MKIEGGCYCGGLRYSAEGEPMARSQCHCRECQYISGGSPNVVMVMPAESFAYTKGQPKAFSRSDLDAPVTREFCAECGTHILTRSPRRPKAVVLKVGTFDDPALFGAPQVAIWTQDSQLFHHIPEGFPVRTVPGMTADFDALYDAFNARDIEAVLARLHAEVMWPNGWEGGTLFGREAVRAYWLRQWAEIDPTVTPMGHMIEGDGRVAIRVRQVVCSLDGAVLSRGDVTHVYRVEDGLIRSMEIRNVQG